MIAMELRVSESIVATGEPEGYGNLEAQESEVDS